MIPAETATKLAKMLPRLASEHDGEVVSTVRAIGRTLAAAKLDWHTLAAVVEVAGSPPDVTLGGMKTEPFDWSGFADFAAGRARSAAAETAKPAPDAPEAPARRWGLPIWGVKKIEPWHVVAGHCLELDWKIPKVAGGRSLSKEDRARLKAIKSYARVSNADADWIEGVVARCHETRDRWRAGGGRATG